MSQTSKRSFPSQVPLIKPHLLLPRFYPLFHLRLWFRSGGFPCPSPWGLSQCVEILHASCFSMRTFLPRSHSSSFARLLASSAPCRRVVPAGIEARSHSRSRNSLSLNQEHTKLPISPVSTFLSEKNFVRVEDSTRSRQWPVKNDFGQT